MPYRCSITRQITTFICSYSKSTAFSAIVALIHQWQILCPLLWQMIVSYLYCSAIIASSFATPIASTTNKQVSTDGNESNNNNELHNDEEEDEMLRMTEALTKMMI